MAIVTSLVFRRIHDPGLDDLNQLGAHLPILEYHNSLDQKRWRASPGVMVSRSDDEYFSFFEQVLASWACHLV